MDEGCGADDLGSSVLAMVAAAGELVDPGTISRWLGLAESEPVWRSCRARFERAFCEQVTGRLSRLPRQSGPAPECTPLRRGLGRPHRRPARALADNAYSSCGNRSSLWRRGIHSVIAGKRSQRANRLKRGLKGGWPQAFDADRYRSATPSNAAPANSRFLVPWLCASTSANASTRTPST
jgi:hypothetical protein